MGKEDMEILEKKIKEGEKKERLELRRRQKELLKKQRVGFWLDFKKFITKGNVLDLAVGIVIATAFNAIVNGLVKMIITPYVTYATSGVSIEEWEHVLRPEVINAEGVVEVTKISVQYGLWIQTIVDFIIIALSVFVAVRVVRHAERKLRAKEIAKAEAEAKKKKVEEDRKAAAEKMAAEERAKAERAERDAYYENIRRQTELLERISRSLSERSETENAE